MSAILFSLLLGVPLAGTILCTVFRNRRTLEIVTVWVRKCSSFAEEREADREFWAAMSPDARVALVEQLRQEWAQISGRPLERLRRIVCVLERQER